MIRLSIADGFEGGFYEPSFESFESSSPKTFLMRSEIISKPIHCVNLDRATFLSDDPQLRDRDDFQVVP